MSNKNIFQRVAAITAELGAIAKDLTVGEGDKAYSATSEAKAPGKAMTYADKYALMKTYKISTGIANDPDSIPSPDEGVAFVETNPLIPSSKNNPMIPATSPAASTPVTQPTQAPAKAAANMQMSLDAARQVIVPFGNYAKKTLGELMTIDRSLVEFYASDRFSRRDTYPQLHEAAQVITQSKAG